MTIDINYEHRYTMPLEKLVDFQGEAKTISDENLEKLKGSIIEHGFFVPIFVWKKTERSRAYVVDGHQRIKALRALEADGYEIPELPIEFIKAKSKKDAALKLAEITSQFGDIEPDNMYDFLSAAGLTIPELENVRLVTTEIMLTPTEFDPVSIDDQGRLDQLEPKLITCPHCGEEFDAREA